MGGWVGALVEWATLTVAGVLLVFGVALILHLRRRGGLEMALVHVLADHRHRTVFLAGLVVSLAALFGIGLADGVMSWLGVSPDIANAVETVLFDLGAAGMLVLMVNALRPPSPSLEEGWILEETAARVSNAATPLPHGRMSVAADEPVPRRTLLNWK